MLQKGIYSLLFVSVLLCSCSGDSGKNEAPVVDTTKLSTNSNELVNAQKILYTLPSPVEAAALMKISGAGFDRAYLNPASNVSKYSSNASRALNLGVYGTDLIYANVFEQNQESAEYFKCANTLATALGISEAFGESTLKRLKANKDNHDSLLSIVAEASLSADSYFKENERPAASAMVAAGGWVEGLYIATRIANKTKNPDIIQRVADQKNSINNLISLVESFGSELELTAVLSDLKEIKSEFDKLEVKKGPGAKGEKAEGVPTIGIQKSITINADQLQAISDKAEMIRNKIIK